MKILLCITFSLLFYSFSTAQLPDWLSNHFEYMTQGSGLWVTDNSEYKSDQEPAEQYATEWKMSLGNQSITGRLFGIIDGKEIGTFWEFRTFWNPVEKKAYAYQFSGSGVVGMGEMWHEGDSLKTRQTFYYPNGGLQENGHIQKDLSGAHETTSFSISEDVWTKNRFYSWELKEL